MVTKLVTKLVTKGLADAVKPPFCAGLRFVMRVRITSLRLIKTAQLSGFSLKICK